jgi:hypothetical protein
MVPRSRVTARRESAGSGAHRQQVCRCLLLPGSVSFPRRRCPCVVPVTPWLSAGLLPTPLDSHAGDNSLTAREPVSRTGPRLVLPSGGPHRAEPGSRRVWTVAAVGLDPTPVPDPPDRPDPGPMPSRTPAAAAATSRLPPRQPHKQPQPLRPCTAGTRSARVSADGPVPDHPDVRLLHGPPNPDRSRTTAPTAAHPPHPTSAAVTVPEPPWLTTRSVCGSSSDCGSHCSTCTCWRLRPQLGRFPLPPHGGHYLGRQLPQPDQQPVEQVAGLQRELRAEDDVADRAARRGRPPLRQPLARRRFAVPEPERVAGRGQRVGAGTEARRERGQHQAAAKGAQIGVRRQPVLGPDRWHGCGRCGQRPAAG